MLLVFGIGFIVWIAIVAFVIAFFAAAYSNRQS